MGKIEKSSKAVVINDANTFAERFSDRKSYDDFDSQGNASAVMVTGKSYMFGDAVELPLTGKTVGYPAFEVYDLKANGTKNNFIGYLSFTKAQARKFVSIATSNAGKLYAKFEVMNRFNAPEKVTYGTKSLFQFAGKKINCVDVIEGVKQPKYEADLSAENVEMDTVNLTILTLV